MPALSLPQAQPVPNAGRNGTDLNCSCENAELVPLSAWPFRIQKKSCTSVASIGNSRSNAISENEASYEPDCASKCEVWHRTVTSHREGWFPAPLKKMLAYTDL